MAMMSCRRRFFFSSIRAFHVLILSRQPQLLRAEGGACDFGRTNFRIAISGEGVSGTWRESMVPDTSALY